MSTVQPPSDHSPHALAEFIEAELVVSGEVAFSIAEIGQSYSSGLRPGDAELEAALLEIERRRSVMGSHYPFQVVDRSVEFDSAGNHVLYSALLLLSLADTPVRRKRTYRDWDAMFDDVVRQAFLALFGSEAKAAVFAWPTPNNRPKKFPKAVLWLANEIGVALRGGKLPGHLKDGGVDLVVWVPFPDGGVGFPIVIVQNTVQFEFRKKPRDIEPRVWLTWLDIGTEPSVGFAIPFLMAANDPWWTDVVASANVVMDRQRIVHSLRDVPKPDLDPLKRLEKFVAAQVVAMQAGPKPGAAVPKTRKKSRDDFDPPLVRP